MNIFLRTVTFLLFIGCCGTTNAMTLGSKYRTAAQRAAIARMPYSDTTKPTIDIGPIESEKETTQYKSLYKPIYATQYAPQQSTNWWNAVTSLWNKWFAKPPAPTIQTLPSRRPVRPLQPTPILVLEQATPPQTISIDRLKETSIQSIDTVTSLAQAKNFLKNREITEFDQQQMVLNITTPQWQNLLQQTKQHIAWTKDNCFTKHNSDATHDNIPENINSRITFFLKKAAINPASININYRDTTHIDPFGHKIISVEGPTLEYAISPTSQGNAITGYKPATITLHSQIVSTLSQNELDAELQHAITHLTQGHNEQLKILENAIGKEQYENYIQSPEGQKLITSLETTADFLESIQDLKTAKIVQKAFFEKAFEAALDAIKKNRRNHGLKNQETGLMVCTPPGIELEFLTELQSFEDIENDFKTQRKKILRKAGLNDDEIKNFENEIENNKEILEKNYYQTPIDGIFHDPTLAPEILEEIKTLLHKAVINPLSIEITNQTKKEMNGAGANAYSPIVWKLGAAPFEKATLTFCQEIINENPRELITWIISHEIGHLIRNHTNRRASIHEAITKKGYENECYSFIVRRAIRDMDALNELEADTTYLMRDFDIAKIAHNQFLRTIAKGQETSRWHSSIHMSDNDRFHWSNKIVQIHAKEKTPEPKPFTPDITRE